MSRGAKASRLRIETLEAKLRWEKSFLTTNEREETRIFKGNFSEMLCYLLWNSCKLFIILIGIFLFKECR